MAGAKEGTAAAAKRRCQELVGVTATPQGEACQRGRGTKKRIDSKLRRLKCLRPVSALGHAKEEVTTKTMQAGTEPEHGFSASTFLMAFTGQAGWQCFL